MLSFASSCFEVLFEGPQTIYPKVLFAHVSYETLGHEPGGKVFKEILKVAEGLRVICAFGTCLEYMQMLSMYSKRAHMHAWHILY